MAVLRLETTVTGDLFDIPDVSLEDVSISMVANGPQSWQSNDDITVKDGILNISFGLKGVPGAKWTFVINQKKAGSSKEIYNKTGKIRASGNSSIDDAVTI